MRSFIDKILSLFGSCSCGKFSCSNNLPDDKQEEEEEDKQVVAWKQLPNDIIEDIFLRLPVESISRLRYVCNAWNLFISDPDFINTHFIRSKQNNNLILLKGRCGFYLFDYQSCDGLVGVDYPSHSTMFHCHFGTLSCCNGLICIGDGRETVWLWNPSTRKHKQLPKSVIQGDYANCKTQLGLAYNPISNDYEVVRAFCFYGEKYHSQVEVYSLRKNSWTRIQNIPYNIHDNHVGQARFMRNIPIMFRGVLHWLGSSARHIHGTIVAFDIGSREFQEVQLPKFDLVKLQWIEICVLDSCLCVLCAYHVQVEVWVMKEYGVKESWVKLLTDGRLKDHIGITEKGQFILQKNYRSLCLYDPIDQSSNDLMTQGVPDIFCIGMCFVENLVQL